MDVVAVVPLKRLAEAKRRLADVLGPAARAELVAFMADRVLRACLSAPSVGEVVAIAGDDAAARLLRRTGVRIVVEPAAGLPAALARADAETKSAAATLVLPADLPAITTGDIEAVCGVAAAPPVVVVVPATDGGTAALLRSPPTVMPAAFGPGSYAAHAALARRAGIEPVTLTLDRLAADVDDVGGLRRAASVEPALRRWLPDASTLHASTRYRDAGAQMPQGTVKHFDIETNTGTILLDDQEELAVDAETFAASGLIELRLGQRVRFEIEEGEDGRRIRRLNLVSF